MMEGLTLQVLRAGQCIYKLEIQEKPLSVINCTAHGEQMSIEIV